MLRIRFAFPLRHARYVPRVQKVWGRLEEEKREKFKLQGTYNHLVNREKSIFALNTEMRSPMENEKLDVAMHSKEYRTVTLPLVSSNSWDAQLVVSNDPTYARLETNLGIGKAKKGNEDATCAWMAAEEAVGCTRAFLTMWPSSQRLVHQVRPESGLHVNRADPSRCAARAPHAGGRNKGAAAGHL
ncbi:hypothetical protein TNCV_2379921 [Trichonephila clavipes]|uniref:Uncharacterized protein n=1 Tax=Trichonephila clavipes TaxID=2585209 RepID=A0A8X6V6H3_TRICX|nr:hypothetical protein TNCV_2379921 [Trichonephila clavipes]